MFSSSFVVSMQSFTMPPCSVYFMATARELFRIVTMKLLSEFRHTFEPDIKAYCHFRECFEDALGNSRDVDSGDFRRLVSRFYPPEFEQIRNE